MRELVVVVDPLMTDTARLATLVLPSTTLLEADDLVGAYGHHWLGEVRPVVPPPPGVKSDLEIIQALGARVGLADVVAGDARAWKERVIAPRLAPHGITLDSFANGPVKNPLVNDVLFDGKKFPTATGRVNLLAATEVPAGAFDPPLPDPEWPLRLLALSTDKAQSSQWSRSPEGPAIVIVHPDAACGIADGALARLESVLGSLVVRVVHDAKQRKDVVVTAKGGHRSAGRCMNSLLRARITDLGEGGALYEECVRLAPL